MEGHCNCNVSKNKKNPDYTHLGATANLEKLRKKFQESLKIEDNAVCIVKVKFFRYAFCGPDKN